MVILGIVNWNKLKYVLYETQFKSCQGQGAGPARYEFRGTQDEVDCGRGRSERSERNPAVLFAGRYAGE